MSTDRTAELLAAVRDVVRDVHDDPLRSGHLNASDIRTHAEPVPTPSEIPYLIAHLKQRGILEVDISNNNRNLYRIKRRPSPANDPAADTDGGGPDTGAAAFNTARELRGGDDE